MLAKERKPQAHSPSPRSIKHCNQPVLSQRRAQNEYSSRNERKKPNLLPAISPKRKAKAKSGARKKERKQKPHLPTQRFRPKGRPKQKAEQETEAQAKAPPPHTAISPKRKAKAKSGARKKERKKESKSPTSPHSDFAQRAKSEEQASEKIPSSVSRRKAEKRSTAKRSAGCLSEASSCASAGRSLAAALKLQTAVFLFVTFFFLPPKRKSKRKANQKHI